MIKASVLIISYNQEKYIDKTLSSVLSQKTSFDYEVVISDDASPDKTQEIIKSYVEKYPDKIKVNFNPYNLGFKKNFMLAYSLCDGEYIAFCEGDDFWLDENKLQIQVDFLENNKEFSFCFSQAAVVDEVGNFIRNYNEWNEDKIFSIEDLFEKNFIATSSVIFRKYYNKLPDVFENAPAGDYPLHILNAEKGKFYYFARRMSVYRKNPSGVWTSLPRKLMALKGVENYFFIDHITSGKYSSFIEKAIKRRLQEFNVDLNDLYLYKDKIPSQVYNSLIEKYFSVSNVQQNEFKNSFNEEAKYFFNAKTVFKNKPKALIIQGGFPSVSATFILDQITGLIDRGFEIENWSTYKIDTNIIHDDIIKYDLLNKTRYISQPPEQLKLDVYQWMKLFYSINNLPENYIDKFDFIHVHYGSNFYWFEPIFKTYLDKFVLVSFHGYDASRFIKQKGNQCYNYLFQRTNLITVPSSALKKRLIELGCPENMITIHRYGKDLKKFSPDEKFIKYKTDKFIFLSVGRFVEKKGFEYSIKAFAKIANKINAEYRIVGEGELEKKLLSLTEELKINDKVVFLGPKTQEEVIEELKNCDIFVLTSVTASDGDTEGLPVVLIEAQAFGKPCISTWHSGIPDLIEHGVNGFLAKEKNVDEISDYMLKLYHDAELRDKFSLKALEKIKAEYDIEVLNNKLAGYFLNSSTIKNNSVSNSLVSFSEKKFCDNENYLKDLKTRLDKINWTYKFEDYKKVFLNYQILREKKNPEASVIIISHRALKETIQSLKILTTNKKTDYYEIIFVNNGEKEENFKEIKKYVDIFISLTENFGAYKARNIGAVFAHGKYLIFLEDDGIPEENFVEAHLKAYQLYDAIVVRGVIKPVTNSTFNLQASHYYLGPNYLCIFCDVEGNVSYEASVFFKVGGWDDNIFFGGGGVELSIRLSKVEIDLRKQIYSPEPVIYHDFAKSEEHLQNKLKKQATSREYLRKKHPIYDSFIQNYHRFSQVVPPKKKTISFDNLSFNIKPFISVCIPTRNRANYLKEAIESVFKQKYENYEIVIVDDGSTDDTKEIVNGFNSQKIRYFYKEHTNAPNTRNRCIQESRGEFILWLDDDDILEENVLINYVQAINDYPDADIFYGILQSFGQSYHLYTYNDWYNKELELIGYLKNGAPIPNGSSLIRKSVYIENGFLDESFLRAHDYFFWTKIALTKKYKFKCINKLTGFYRIHQSNLTGELKQNTDYSYENRILRYILQNAYIQEIYPEKLWNYYFESSMNEALLDLSSRFINRGDIEYGLICFIKSLEYDRSEQKFSMARQFLNDQRLLTLFPSVMKNLNKAVNGEKTYPDFVKIKKEELEEKQEYDNFVNIGMITYNRLEFTKQSIESIIKHTKYPYVLTVVDNGSSDGTKEYLLELKNKGVIKNLILLSENVGVAKASNIAWIIEPKAKYYLKLDNDIVVEKDGWLETMVETIEKIPQAGAVAYNFEPISYPLLKINGILVRPKIRGNLGGACILIPRRTVEKIGYWRDDYGLYGEEDADYGVRISLSNMINIYMADEDIGKHLPSGKAAVIDPITFEAKDGVEEQLYPEYRKFKDELRRKNASENGAFRRNEELYKTKHLPLFYFSNFAAEFLRKYNIEPGTLQGVLFIQNEIKKIEIKQQLKVFAILSNKTEACSYLRIAQVLENLKSQNIVSSYYLKDLIEKFENYISLNELNNSDIFIFQRYVNKNSEILFSYIKKLNNKKIIYEIDDNFFEICPENINYNVIKNHESYIKFFLKNSDLVTVSVSYLRKKFLPYTNNIAVLPNLLDPKIWNFNFEKKKNKKIKILFSGTPTHDKDFKIILPALKKIIENYREKVEFYYVGVVDVKELYSLNAIKAFDFTGNYFVYAKNLQKLNADIGLIPLEVTEFNRSKSNIKWLEYSINKIASIMTDIEPYNQSVINRYDGLLIENTEEAWYNALKELIENDELRNSISKNAFNRVSREFSLENKSYYWKLIYDLLYQENKPLVSIIIPVYNKLELTKKCLQGILENDAEVDFEIIIVDNDSSDGTKEYCEKLSSENSRVKYFRNETNLGFSKANNIGVKYSSGKYLMFLNNDTYPLNGWLKSSIDIIENDIQVGAVGSKLIFPDDTIQHAGVIIVDDKRISDPLVARHIFYKLPKDNPEANIAMEYQALTAACLLVKKTAFLEVFGFDEEYWNGYEDVDLCFKLKKAGYKLIYNPASVVYHYESQSGPERFAKVKNNIERLHLKWLGKIKPDFIVFQDSTIIKTEENHLNIKPYLKEDQKLENAIIRDINLTEEDKIYSEAFVSIIILTYNQLKYTKECLESLYENTKIKFETIIVDNASVDGTREYLQNFANEKKNVKLIFNENNLGFPTAVNQGIKASDGNYIVIANNDIVFTKRWLEGLLKAINKKNYYMIAGPISNLVSGFQIDQNARYKSVEEMKKYADEARIKNKDMFFEFPRVAFLCALIKRELIDKIGGLDERFSPGNFEDDDFCLRAQLAGYKTIIVKDVFIHHYGSKSFTAEGMQKYADRLNKNRQIFVEKWGADPDELWLKGKPIKIRKYYYPINKNYLIEKVERIKLHIDDGELNLAEREINLANEYLKNNSKNIDQEILKRYYEILFKFDSLKDHNIKEFEELLSKAYENYTNKNFENSVELFEKAKAIYENYQNIISSFTKNEIYSFGGAIYLSVKNYEKAIKYFEIASQSDKNDYKALEGLSEAYLGIGDTQKAFEYLKKAIEINSNDKELQNKFLKLKTTQE